LMAVLSHELRNPLQGITLSNHLLTTHIKNSADDISNIHNINPKMIKYLEIIGKSCVSMKKIINDVLDLSKIEEKEFNVDLDICNVRLLVETAIGNNINEAEEKNLFLYEEVDSDVPINIYTDFTRIIQVLDNLISNAIKYTEVGKIILKISVDKCSDIKFSVVDNGIGIRNDEICKIFKTYGQSNNNKLNVNSQGLGLCISQKIANLLGGKITVKSEHKKGSTFSFYHPLKLSMSYDKYETEIQIGNISGNILIVDDDMSNLSLLHTLLEQFKFEYTWAITIESVNSAEKAIQLCNINHYDAIFMDINMPGINGNTASKIIKGNGYSGKIIATTGDILMTNENSNICSSGECNTNERRSFDEIIIKPFDDQTILKMLKKVMIVY